MIGIEPVLDPSAIDVREHGLMLPIPSMQHNTVLLEPRDGNNVQTLTAKAVRLERNGSTVFRCTNVRINVFITDARVALACSKYDKGGGWIGSPGAMVMANAVSKGLAAIRRHGKMMVGHVRYPWLMSVGSTARQGMGSEERLVLEGKTDQATSLRLTLLLPKDVDAAAVAAEVTRRATRYRLQCEPNLDAGTRSALSTFTSARPLPAGAKNIIQFHRVPTFYFINVNSARMAPVGNAPASLTASVAPAAPALPTTMPAPRPQLPMADKTPAALPSGTFPDLIAPSTARRPAPGERIVVSLEDL
jgi:hypothetical protein